MRVIHVTFEDSEHEQLKKHKAGRTWHDYILSLINGRVLHVQRP